MWNIYNGKQITLSTNQRVIVMIATNAKINKTINHNEQNELPLRKYRIHWLQIA